MRFVFSALEARCVQAILSASRKAAQGKVWK
jgi:hypothetical protein